MLFLQKKKKNTKFSSAGGFASRTTNSLYCRILATRLSLIMLFQVQVCLLTPLNKQKFKKRSRVRIEILLEKEAAPE